MTITTFSEAKDYLRQFYNHAAEYKLDTITAFMKYLGNPQDKVNVIHVAGTSGKTSTCYYIAALMRAAGYTVGHTVSPHVDEINERVQINLQPLPEAVFCDALSEFSGYVAGFDQQLSYFEVMVALAYWYFAKVGVDYAVIEVGLGGRIDGTNVVSREDKVSVITNIGFDHTKILGNTLPEIAAEKAGIILRGNDVFTHAQAPEIIDVFQRVCRQKEARLHIIEELQDTSLAALPLFQQHNMGLAIAAAGEALARRHRELKSEYIREAANTYVPARMETVRYQGKTIIVDGAHNGQKLRTLLESVKSRYPRQPLAALVAFVDGDEQRMHEGLTVLMKCVDALIITEFTSEQDVPKKSVPAENIAAWCKQHGYAKTTVIPDPLEALNALTERPEAIVLVTGSFYLLNHIRPHIIKS